MSDMLSPPNPSGPSASQCRSDSSPARTPTSRSLQPVTMMPIAADMSPPTTAMVSSRTSAAAT